jgi:NADPH:quinone reductase
VTKESENAMKAMLCKAWGPPESLVLEDIPEFHAEPGKVVVSVKACGVNFPDTLIIQNKYQFKPPLPFAPGGEVAGVVKEVGEGVQHVKPGDSVIAFTGSGGFAEEVLADAGRVIPMPQGMDFITASAFVMTYGTSLHALRDRAKLQSGESLVVLGAAGGVGLAAVELGHLMGAKVIAAASTPEKLALCKQHGADEIIDYSKEDLKERIRALTDGKGADVIYDPVGGDYAEPAIRALGWGGRFLVVGFAAGEIPRIPLNLTLLKGSALVGVFWGEFLRRQPKDAQKELFELLGWFREGKLKPHISATYPLAQAARALNDVLERKVTGKVVVTMG